MIQIIPAIDLIEGQCVRLTQGDFNTKKTYSADPVEVALRFEDAGITRLHLVDLDGARAGKLVNYKVLERISSRTALLIDFGGGIRADDDLRIAFECGAAQVTAGSIAATQRDLCLTWLERFGPEKIILGADVRDGKIAVSGWSEASELDLTEFVRGYREAGVKYVICTDITKDGLLKGPNLALYEALLGEVEGISLIASGGVTSMGDLEALRRGGVYGAIIGKALYEGRIKLADLKVYL